VQFFIETTEAEELRRAAALGVLDGVHLPAAPAAGSMSELAEICALLPGPVIVGVAGEGLAGLRTEALRLGEIAKNLLPLLPPDEAGLEVLSAMASKGMEAAIGPCENLGQALLAAKAGARVLTVDSERPGLLDEIIRLYQNYGFATEILAASLRRSGQLLEAARGGADAASFPVALLRELVATGHTDKSEEERT
jgi:transaldolase